jgi:putative flippase GtrA
VWRQLALFSVAGTVGFLVDAGILYLLLGAGAGYFAGRAASFLCAVWVTWGINRRLAFRDAAPALGRDAGWRYLLAMSGGGLVNYATYCAAVVLLPEGTWTPLAGVALGSVFGLAVNFASARLWVFR